MQGFFQIQANELEAIWLSMKVASITTLISLPFAVFFGYVLARKEFKGKAFIEGFLHLPLVMPPVTTGYLLLLFLGTNGIIGQYLAEYFGIKLAFSFPATVIAATFVAFPLVVRSVRTAIEMVDPGLEDSSMILGASRLKTIFQITIPLAFPGILSGAILCFARSLGEFGATISFAGNIAGETQTLSLAIYSYMQIPGYEIASIRLVLLSVIISLAAMIVSEWYSKRLKH